MSFPFSYLETTKFQQGTKCKIIIIIRLLVYEHLWGKNLQILPRFHHFPPLHKIESGCHLQTVTFRYITSHSVIMFINMLKNKVGPTFYQLFLKEITMK